jgi:hypothetical protein
MVLRFVVLVAHAPATMPTVQQLVSDNTQAECNTTGIHAAVLLHSFICAYRRLQGTAVVLEGQVAETSVFHVLRHFKVEGL